MTLFEEGVDLAEELKLTFVETSAKVGSGVDELFITILKRIKNGNSESDIAQERKLAQERMEEAIKIKNAARMQGALQISKEYSLAGEKGKARLAFMLRENVVNTEPVIKIKVSENVFIEKTWRSRWLF